MTLLAWPSQFPDLKAIDNLWWSLKARKRRNFGELKMICWEERAKIEPQFCKKWITPYHRHLKAVISAPTTALLMNNIVTLWCLNTWFPNDFNNFKHIFVYAYEYIHTFFVHIYKYKVKRRYVCKFEVEIYTGSVKILISLTAYCIYEEYTI